MQVTIHSVFLSFQTLPVVPRASRAEVMNETFKSSELWNQVKKYKLTENMRLKGVGPEIKEFSEYLVRIGEGKEPTHPEIGEDMIKIRDEHKSSAKNLTEFCDEIYKGEYMFLKFLIYLDPN